MVCKWNACKWKSVENSVCSLDDPTTTAIPTTTEAEVAEQRLVPLSSSSTTTSTTTSTSTSTTTSTASKTTSTTTSTLKMSKTSMTKEKPVLTTTDSRLLFVEPEIYQSDPARNDLNLKNYFRDKKNLNINYIFESFKSLKDVKISQLIGTVRLGQNITRFASDNVKQMCKQKQSNANARIINVDGSVKENHVTNYGSLVHKRILTSEPEVKPEVKPEMNLNSILSDERTEIC